jgi:hypothetical protein
MFYQLLIDDYRADRISDFESELQRELIQRGEVEGEWGPHRLPVSEVDHLEGIGKFYIRVYQHRLTDEDMQRLVGDLCERLWDCRDACQIESVAGREP